MSILPIIDFLILLASAVLAAGVLLKAIYVTTLFRPTLLGMSPMDCAMAAGIFLLFALTLVARTWVKTREPGIMAARRMLRARDAAAQAEERFEESDALSLRGNPEES